MGLVALTALDEDDDKDIMYSYVLYAFAPKAEESNSHFKPKKHEDDEEPKKEESDSEPKKEESDGEFDPKEESDGEFDPKEESNGEFDPKESDNNSSTMNSLGTNNDNV